MSEGGRVLGGFRELTEAASFILTEGLFQSLGALRGKTQSSVVLTADCTVMLQKVECRFGGAQIHNCTLEPESCHNTRDTIGCNQF